MARIVGTDPEARPYSRTREGFDRTHRHFTTNEQWQRAFVPLVVTMFNEKLPPSLFSQTRVAPRELDIKQNADLTCFPYGGRHVAMRLRRPGFLYRYGLDVTIRTQVYSGNETELAKIMRGFGDWLIYGHIERQWVAE